MCPAVKKSVVAGLCAVVIRHDSAGSPVLTCTTVPHSMSAALQRAAKHRADEGEADAYT
jgi:hypothetical protein